MNLTSDSIETEIDSATFRRIAEVVYEKAGIKLGEKKEALVAARMGKRMRRLGIRRFRDYLRFLEESPEDGEWLEMLDAISTNVTHFFREPKHFERLAAWLAQWHREGRTRFRLWSAAASSGEEPCSMAMVVRETLPEDCDVRILGTDLSTRALAEARAGIYSKRDIEPIPLMMVQRYLRRQEVGEGDGYRTVSEISRMITLARLNLAHPPYPMRGPFDVIFCRNVMIYFDDEVRRRLLDECWRLLRHGGYLVVGHAESLSGLISRFKGVEPSIYVKP